MKLNFSSYFKLIYRHRKSTVKNHKCLYDCFLVCCKVDPDSLFVDRAESSFVNSRSNLPELALTNLTKISHEELASLINNNICPLIRENDRQSLIEELLLLIKEDVTIDDNSPIGSPRYGTKLELLEDNQFYLPDLLAQLFIYCAENFSQGKRIGEKITADFLERAKQYVSIKGKKIVESEQIKKKTILVDEQFGFSEGFEKAFSSTVSLPGYKNMDNVSWSVLIPHSLRKNKYDILKIQELAQAMIMRFVYSRGDLQSIACSTNQSVLVQKTVQATRIFDAYASDNKKDRFSEVMAMGCIEEKMHAPKILSAYELNSQGNYRSTGIHLKRADGKISLIFGLAVAEKSLDVAMQKLATQADNVADNENNELKIISSNLNDLRLSKHEEDEILSIIMPQRGYTGTASKPEFAGVICSDGPDKGINKEDYQQATISNFQQICSTFKVQLQEHDIDDYNFSIYLIPFNDVENEANL